MANGLRFLDTVCDRDTGVVRYIVVGRAGDDVLVSPERSWPIRLLILQPHEIEPPKRIATSDLKHIHGAASTAAVLADEFERSLDERSPFDQVRLLEGCCRLLPASLVEVEGPGSSKWAFRDFVPEEMRTHLTPVGDMIALFLEKGTRPSYADIRPICEQHELVRELQHILEPSSASVKVR